MARLFSISRLVMLALVIATAAPSGVKVKAPASSAVALYEVRLRKLHLVRPDLIPYPVVYEVLC
jgi:hypothetical protein